ncbi:MAG: GntR family transcriptional regulator [Pseudonocardiales bacterium]|nr:GntR family transcriptional regulator [Pseudonocardiales bacterium]
MRVNPSDPTPAYIQIADDLRRAIERDELRDGAPLPSLRQMEEEYGASAGTVRQALDQLRSEGIIMTRQGQGTYVRKPRRLRREGTSRHLRSQRQPGTAPLEAEAQDQNFQRGQDLLEVTTGPAPADIAHRLRLPPESSVVIRRHLLTLDGEPAQTADSYFPAEIVRGTPIAQSEKIPGGVHAELARILGVTLSHATEDLIARMPTPTEARTLRLPPGTPIVDLTRTIYAQDHNPVEVTRFIFDGSRHLFTYRVPMD